MVFIKIHKSSFLSEVCISFTMIFTLYFMDVDFYVKKVIRLFYNITICQQKLHRNIFLKDVILLHKLQKNKSKGLKVVQVYKQILVNRYG